MRLRRREIALARLVLAETLGSSGDAEVVKTVLAGSGGTRIRASTQVGRDARQRITTVRLTLARDGEIVGAWSLPHELLALAAGPAGSRLATARDPAMRHRAADAVSALMLYGEAALRWLNRSEPNGAEARLCARGLVASAVRAELLSGLSSRGVDASACTAARRQFAAALDLGREAL